MMTKTEEEFQCALRLGKKKSAFTQHQTENEKKIFSNVCTLLTTKLLPIINCYLVLACLTSIVSIALNQGYTVTSVRLFAKSNLTFTELEELQVARINLFAESRVLISLSLSGTQG